MENLLYIIKPEYFEKEEKFIVRELNFEILDLKKYSTYYRLGKYSFIYDPCLNLVIYPESYVDFDINQLKDIEGIVSNYKLTYIDDSLGGYRINEFNRNMIWLPNNMPNGKYELTDENNNLVTTLYKYGDGICDEFIVRSDKLISQETYDLIKFYKIIIRLTYEPKTNNPHK